MCFLVNDKPFAFFSIANTHPKYMILTFFKFNASWPNQSLVPITYT